jgi:copper(I)-binding protein
MKILLLVTGAVLALARIGALGAEPFAVRAADAWIRWLPGNLPSAGYITLTNQGTVSQVLVGASSADYGDVTLHRTRTTQGMSAMAPVPSITLGPGASVDFAERGYHFMLMQPHRSIRAGEQVAVTLHFSNGQSITVSFEVRGPSADRSGRNSGEGLYFLHAFNHSPAGGLTAPP